MRNKDSQRLKTFVEDRATYVIEKNSSPNRGNKTKMTEYLSDPDVKAFHRTLVSEHFDKLAKKRYCQNVFYSYDECLEEVENYFKLCDKHNMIPTIASMALYLGVNQNTVYTVANDLSNSCSEVIQSAIATCRAYHENAFMCGEIPPVSFIFYSKNYYGMTDTTSLQLTNSNSQDNTINTNTIETIKEQLALEQTFEKQGENE